MRDKTYDIAKALMMLWVVWGHLMRYEVVEYDTSIYMLNAKIGVNMPVFFVIGGCLASLTFTSADWPKLMSRAIHFLWPQFAVAIAYALLLFVVGGHGGRAFSWVMGAWFLHTYALVYLISAIIFRITVDNNKRWILFSLCYLVMIFWPSQFRLNWCGQVIHMFPYFVFGLMCLRKKMYFDWRIGCVCGVLYLAAVFLQGDSSQNGMNFWKVDVNWNVLLHSWRDGVTFIARTVVGICGSIFVLFIVSLLIKVIPCIAILSSLGMTTLGVYVLHEYPLFLLGKHMSILPLPSWLCWFVAICWFGFCHCLVILLKRWTVVNVVFFGNEMLLANAFRKIHDFVRVR